MAIDFAKYAAGGNSLLQRLDQQLGHVGTEHAGRVLRAVLHALRNRLTIEESIHFIAQLPMAVKGIYVDGWKLARPDRAIRDADDFAQEVIREGGRTAWRDFASAAEAGKAAAVVFHVLSDHISAGEWEDIKAILPAALRTLVDNWRKQPA